MTVQFTHNKQIVRDYQGNLIAEIFKTRLGNLAYFGLPSPDMMDVRDWLPLFSKVIAVERPTVQSTHRDQHRLLLTASLYGIDEKLYLLRGDIDEIILSGRDDFDNPLIPPFDVVSLDYSGGLFYKKGNRFLRLEAIKKLIEINERKIDGFLLFISANCHAIDQGEIKDTLQNIRTELNRMQKQGDKLYEAYMSHPSDIVRLVIYVSFFIRMTTAARNCHTKTYPAISYPGNRGMEMINFRFLIRPNALAVAPRFPQERLNQILNTPLIRLENGKKVESPFKMPKVRDRLLSDPNGTDKE